MESETGHAPNDCTTTTKESENRSSNERSDAFTSTSLDGGMHSLEHNDVSCIAGIKLISNMVVKKKRGRRAPPSYRRLSGNKIISREDAVDNYKYAIEEGQAGKSQSISHIEESIDGRTGGLDIPKTAILGNSSDLASCPSRKAEGQDQSANPKDLFEKACRQGTEMVTKSSAGCEESLWNKKESDNSRGRQDKLCLKQDELNIKKKCKDVSASEACEKSNTLEDASIGQASARNVNSEDKPSVETIDNVKVCDICGDVGEEERLAVCSRCNDGAEHIYCMRVMMEDVPVGEWLCEECETELEFEKEKKKLEKSQVKVGASKGLSFEGKTDKLVNASKSSYDDEALEAFEGKTNKLDSALKNKSSENEVDAENGDNKELNSGNRCNNLTMKRKEEDAGIISSIRQNLPERGGSSIGAESRKRVPLSRESSLRLDADKGKQSTTQGPTSLAFDVAKNLAPPFRGQFSKSSSFNNSKVPKVKHLVNEVPQKPNNLKDHSSFITKKEGQIGILAKSPFFKKPKSCDPSNKAKSLILPPTEELKVINPAVSHNGTNDRGVSILGCPSVSGSMVTPASSKEESTAECLTTGNNIADSNNLSIAHVQGGRNSLGYCEINKPPGPPGVKAPASITLSCAERSSGILGCGTQRKVIQNTGHAHRDDKVKDSTSMRPGVSCNSRTMRCQRCNEAGHSTQFCSVDKLSLSAVKPIGERNMKDSAAKRNKISEATCGLATDRAASRPVDQSEHILKCGPYHNPTYTFKDILSTSFGHVKKPSQLYGRTSEHDIKNTLISRASTDCDKLKSKECQTVLVTGKSVDSSFSMADALMEKSSKGLLPGDEPIVSTVPELDFIWQGGFELWRTGRSPELCDGFQAHLSCSASPKVLEVAKKFPSNVQLEELPRQNSWPTQFQENGPSYENIGLFFFARDTNSYENHYSKLVENMLKNDLALRGNIETAELLIFPSNILSKNFQRWNMFYFLWGVFRVRKKDHMHIPPDVPISSCESNLNPDSMEVDPSTFVLTSGHSFSEDQSNGAKLEHDLFKSADCAEYQCPQTAEANHHGFSNGENISHHPVGRTNSGHDRVSMATSSSTNSSTINHSPTDLAAENQKVSYSEGQDTVVDCSNGNAGKPMFDVNTVPVTCSISSVHEKGKESRFINLNRADNLVDIDINSSEVNSVTVDPVSHIPASVHKRNIEAANWVDQINGKLEQKKVKYNNVVSANSSLCENATDGRLSSKVHPLVSSSFDDSVDQSLAGSSKCNGKCVFPLDLNAVDDSVTENIVNILSSDDEDLPEHNVPDLLLELGDNKSPRKTMFSFLPPKAGENQNKEHSLPTNAPGSLSLSLAFPAASREHAGKLQPELQGQLPDMSSQNKLSSIWDRQ